MHFSSCLDELGTVISQATSLFWSRVYSAKTMTFNSIPTAKDPSTK